MSPVPLTLPSHASLFTGLWPQRHGVRDNGQLLAPGFTTLAEALRSRGYTTGAFVSGFPLQALFGLDQGFDRYDDDLPDGDQGWLERKANGTVEAGLSWLSDTPAPWFAWFHFYDPHHPYEPPRIFWAPGERGAYDGEVAFVDHWIGRLLEGVEGLGSEAPLLTVLTADHGEALGEHDEERHGYFVYDSTMTVPLIFHEPRKLRPAASPLAARLVDVPATILDLVAGPALPDLDGVSLRPTLEGREQELPPAYLESFLPWRFFGWAPLQAVRHRGFKLIRAPRPELYDLRTDPAETTNLIARERTVARELAAELRRLDTLSRAPSATLNDAQVVAKLRALGYTGAGGGVGTDIPSGLPDPKDRIDRRRQLLIGEELLRAGRREEAVEHFAGILREDPDDRYATLRSGIALLQLGRPGPAVPLLRRAVAQDPDRAETRFALADALTRTGAFEAARDQWAELVRLQPRRFEAWANLGTALAALGQYEAAADAFSEALRLDPGNADLAEKVEETRRRQANPSPGP